MNQLASSEAQCVWFGQLWPNMEMLLKNVCGEKLRLIRNGQVRTLWLGEAAWLDSQAHWELYPGVSCIVFTTTTITTVTRVFVKHILCARVCGS